MAQHEWTKMARGDQAKTNMNRSPMTYALVTWSQNQLEINTRFLFLSSGDYKLISLLEGVIELKLG